MTNKLNTPNTQAAKDQPKGPEFCGIAPTPITKRQRSWLAASVGKMVWLKADRQLGVGREQVKLLAVDFSTNTATIEVPDWGTETAWLYQFVKLY